ncbi:DUF1045 domain-containing protein [Methylopila sp. Yamaguchi]|uniref:DUF1045 domain-containing protein n=1 Tax=Methylopila sp. Yamaguchi TaxID=1437817 RepID=UPI000CB7AF03|nr:DUF1045 domain-containing protein [Methylopila sp. Yamaguchi]GBD47685.1 hypothetical protein METY_0898 [Methylopila sp. Yamaguchi]
MSDPRYAIYYAPPPESALWTFGCRVLGYDAATGAPAPALGPLDVKPKRWAEMTAAPRRYGFHGTLKAPFRLSGTATEDDLVAAGRAFAQTQAPFPLPPLKVAALGSFVALVPEGKAPELARLSDACVEAFDRFRAAANAAERARRQEAPLTERQTSSLERWGYPYVFEDFRFHMTLTGALPEDDVAPTVEALARLYADHVGAAATEVNAVTLFVEENPAEGFRIVDRFVFQG